MVDERNADSVLFQLDQLSTPPKDGAGGGDMLSRMGEAKPASGNAPQKPPGSGLIDLKTLMSGSQSEASASDHLMSSNSLVAEQASLLASSSPSVSTQAPQPQPVAPSRTPLIILTVLAVLALITVVVAVALRG